MVCQVGERVSTCHWHALTAPAHSRPKHWAESLPVRKRVTSRWSLQQYGQLSVQRECHCFRLGERHCGRIRHASVSSASGNDAEYQFVGQQHFGAVGAPPCELAEIQRRWLPSECRRLWNAEHLAISYDFHLQWRIEPCDEHDRIQRSSQGWYAVRLYYVLKECCDETVRFYQ